MNRWGMILLLWSLSLQALELQSWQTASGTRVIFAPADQLPIVDIRVLFDAGSARDGQAHGLAYLSNALLLEGAGEWNADQLAQQLEEQGIEIKTEADRDKAWISLRSLSDKKILTLAVEMLTRIIAEPHFDESAIARVKQSMQAQIRLNQQSASKSAKQALLAAIYGQHPYAHDPLGSESSLQAISRKQIQAFHRTYYVAPNAVIAIVGNLDRAQAESLAKRITSKMPQGQKAAPIANAPLPASQSLNIPFDSSQTHCYLGLPGINYQHKDYFALIVGNHIFGGSGLTSILGEEIRNRRGLSYGISSRFIPLKAGGYWYAAAQTQNKQAQQTMDLMRQLLEQFIRQGPSPEQLEAAKKHLIGSFPLKLASNKKILQQISLIAFYDLPLNWLDVYRVRIEQITAEQIKTAFAQQADAHHLIRLMLGHEK